MPHTTITKKILKKFQKRYHQDLKQEIDIKIWLLEQKYKEELTDKFLWHPLFNICVDFLRKEKRHCCTTTKELTTIGENQFYINNSKPIISHSRQITFEDSKIEAVELIPSTEDEVKNIELRSQLDFYTDQLTMRQKEVVKLINQGYSTKEISQQLFVSQRTIQRILKTL